jgi:CheY-like chemotaxis protein
MGGRIGVDSEPGQGSLFHFELPLPAVAAPAAAMPVSAAKPVRRLRLLLVEDNEINQQVASAILERAGHDCVVAETGRAALALVQEEAFDAILMDLQMPEMDGFEATRRIRALGAKGRMPIIALTANAMPEDVARARAAGMNGHLAKPIRPLELSETLAAIAAAGTPSVKGVFAEGQVQPGTVAEGADVLLVGPADVALHHRLSRIGLRVFPMPDVKAAATLYASRAFPVVLVRGADGLAMARLLTTPEGNRPLIAIWQDGGDVLDLQSGELALPAAADDDELRRRLFGGTGPTGAAADIGSLFDDVKVKALQGLFLRNLLEQRQALKPETLDLQHILQIAHRVKGSAANMGYADLAARADAVLAEQSGRQGPAVRALIEILDETIDMLGAALMRGSSPDGARRAE